MKRAGRNLVYLAVMGVFNMWGIGSAVEVLEPGYVVETYAGYSDAGIERSPWDMVFVPDGNLYATQIEGRSLWRISPDGIAEEAATGLGRPTGLVWGGGTAYGDYLYVAVTDTGVVRVHLDGTVEGFASRSCAGTLGLDRAGNYGGFMYTTTGCVDHTYVVHPDGSVALFSNWPTHINGGGPHNVTVDNIGNYNNLLYIASSFSSSTPHVSGVFSMDQGGNASRFAPAIVVAHNVDFDPGDGFDGDMFVIGRSGFGEPDLLWRVSPNGIATEFAALSGLAPRGLTFGPDGAMYVGEYISQTEEVIVSRISPYAPIAVAVDIKPGSCPNPLNLGRRGRLPAAILGSEDFDVNAIDITSIRLAGVAPIRSSLEDVATLVSDGNECDCTTAGPDGYADLTLKFETEEVIGVIAETVADMNSGETLVLPLVGVLMDETAIEGADCVVIRGKVPSAIRAKKSDVNEDGIVDMLDLATMTADWLEFTVP
jgi:sugar lactone lactonase YvrE